MPIEDQKAQPIARDGARRAPVDLDLPLTVDRDSGGPLPAQIAAWFRGAIRDGRLDAAAALPPSRALARALGVARHVVVSAYEELIAEGYLTARQGAGIRVSLEVVPAVVAPARIGGGRPRWLLAADAGGPAAGDGASEGGAVLDFRLGAASVAPLPPEAWRRAWRTAAAVMPPCDYGPPAGEPALREQIAHYLRRTRGLACGADAVIVTSGATQAIAAIVEAVVRPGDTVALEEPGYPPARRIAVGRGARLLPVPVDDDGMRVAALPTGTDAPILVHVTPAHQYPLGGRLPLPRRQALLAWAAASDSLILENDYDSEFRYGSAPLPALASLAGGAERVAYVGTFSKVLSPALRVGYIVAPPGLHTRIACARARDRDRVSHTVQLAVAALIAAGDLERHIRRVRRHHARRRTTLLDALASLPDDVRVRGAEGGLHVVLDAAASVDIGMVLRDTAACGVAVEDVADYYLDQPDRRGLLLGYGGLEPVDVERGAAILLRALRAAVPAHHASQAIRFQAIGRDAVSPGHRLGG